MGHFYMENICTMDEQRKCELKIIAGKIGWMKCYTNVVTVVANKI